MMSLRQQQIAMGQALWGKQGLNTLANDQQWEAFLKFAEGSPLASLSRKRLALYESLLKNTVAETLSVFFPFCRIVIGNGWDSLTEHYRRLHPNQSFLLYHCAQHFPGFLSNQQALCEALPFLPELALFEWLEVAVENAPPHTLPSNFQENLPEYPAEFASTAPVWNPTIELTTWCYAIPALLKGLNPEDGITPTREEMLGLASGHRQPLTLFIYRDTVTHRARYFEINGLTAQLFQLASSRPDVSYLEQLQHLKITNPSLAHLPMETVLEQGLKLLKQCRSQSILLGSVTVVQEWELAL